MRPQSPHLLVGLRVLIGLVLVYAGLQKVFHPDLFADVVVNYRLLPLSLAPWVALALPWLELLTGLCLIVSVAVESAALLAAAMFSVFVSASLSTVARGLDISCGCFNASAQGHREGYTMWLSLALACASVLVLWDQRRRRAQEGSPSPRRGGVGEGS